MGLGHSFGESAFLSYDVPKMIVAYLAYALAQSPSGSRVYADMITKLSSVNTISGVRIVHLGGETSEVSFLMARPSKYKLTSSASETFGDGSEIVIYNEAKKEVLREHLAVGTKAYPIVGLETLFTDNTPCYSIEGAAETVLIDRQKVWEIHAKQKVNPAIDVTLFIDQETMLPRGSRSTSPAGSVLEWLADIKCNPIVDKSAFDWSPPKGSHEVSENPGAEKLLLVGSVAPDFKLKTPEGVEVTLSHVASTHKATVLSFWFYGCMACRQETPDLVATYIKYKSQGVEVLGIDVADPMYRVQAYRKELLVTYPLLGGGAATGDTYGIIGCPTTYVIDAKRRIVATIVGGRDIEKLNAALQSLGLKPATPH
jgi:peroxiredoxin/outer membrane lipoprotein-sorting protein